MKKIIIAAANNYIFKFLKKKIKYTKIVGRKKISYNYLKKKKPDIIFFPPSNPLLSIEPILQISSIKKAIIKSSSKKIAISPIINGKSIKGPLSKILSELGIENSIRGIGNYYADIADTFFIDESDKEDLNLLNDIDLHAEVANILLVDKKLSPKYTREILNRIID